MFRNREKLTSIHYSFFGISLFLDIDLYSFLDTTLTRWEDSESENSTTGELTYH